MGLDMYLEHIHRNADEYRNVNLDDFDVNSKLYKTLAPYFHQCGSELYSWTSLFEEVGYWRKANAIHKWFVENVQNGEDDCGRYEVSKEQLEELLDVCKEVLDKVVMAPGKIVNGQRFTKNGCEDILEDMRNTNRIYEILDALRQAWEKYPDWRFFQLVCNLQKYVSGDDVGGDCFYVEDDKALEAIKKMFALEEDNS